MNNPIDSVTAHKHFSASCFNEVWGYLDNNDRTVEETEKMVECAHASLYHWLQRDDVTQDNKSIGYWQLSRVYATIENGVQALQYGLKALAAADKDKPFMVGYGHEAVARAAKVSGDGALAQKHLDLARTAAADISEKGDRKALLG